MTQKFSFWKNKFSLFIFQLGLIGGSLAFGQESEMPGFSPEQLQADFKIVKKAYQSLHAGLYRYVDEKTMNVHFDDLEAQFKKEMSLADAFLTYSKFLAKIKCGHTYTNYWNQPKIVKEQLFYQPDKVPFTFRLVEERMIVTKSASENELLQAGLEILSINEIPVKTIIDSLQLVVKTDGSNLGQQLYEMQLLGYGDYEAFDIYFPLFFPPVNSQFKLKVFDFQSKETKKIVVEALNRKDRFDKIEKRYGKQVESYDDLWEFKILSKEVAYLRAGTFVTWKMELDWKRFLKDAFAEIKAKNIPNLIIDIRGNGGGMADVNFEILKNLTKDNITIAGEKSLVRYEKISPDLDSYLSTWDNSFKNISSKVEPYGDGFFKKKNASTEAKIKRGSKKAYKGKTWLLVDASNSSATFYLAKICKENELATLVGQTTGGNLKGITGGQMFFLNLPNTKIEMDLPLIASSPLDQQPDAGIQPDILVAPKVEDLINEVDTELEIVLKNISLSN